MKLPFLRLLRLLPFALLLAAPAGLPAQPDSAQSFGVLRPQGVYQPTLVAVAPFGREGEAPVEWETMPRVIRRDLELSGFFKLPDDQLWVNRQNLAEMAGGKGPDFPVWQQRGFKHYLMGKVEVDGSGKLRVRVLLYDIDSQALLINRFLSGDPAHIRELAHQVSDEVVRFTKHCEGIASTHLLFITEQVPGVKEVATMDADGFNHRPVTRYNNICTTPSWGANGTEIFYTSYHGHRANIYGQILSDGRTWTIAAYGGTNHGAEWSQTAQRLVLTLSKDGNSEIYTANRDGSGARRLTESKATDGSPTWSPDGSRVCYVSDESGSIQLWMMGADGSGKRQLTRKGSWNDAPSWSPDGQRIAFVSRDGGINDIFVIDASGDAASVRRMTMGQGHNE
ncbi:PD40 domain-containing protein, partial [Candidatus Poribacteria bacterium]|nr:PD40 domain-containing protein [Candidatus Poribacteria bacterium]